MILIQTLKLSAVEKLKIVLYSNSTEP